MMHARRRGMALIVVMVLTLMVALGAYGFMSYMQSEYQSSKSAKERASAKQASLSGLEYSLSLIELPFVKRSTLGSFDENPELFQAIAVESEEGSKTDQAPAWSFCLVSPAKNDHDTNSVGSRRSLTEKDSRARRVSNNDDEEEHYRFGLENESAKVNLAILPVWDRLQPGTTSKFLASLPGAEESAVRAAVQELGLLPDSNQERNSRRRSMRTSASSVSTPIIQPPQHLWDAGDFNGNYRIDPFEKLLMQQESQLRDRSPSSRGLSALPSQRDPRSANIAIGWNRYLTWHSGQRNANREGTPRIDLNHPDLSRLHQQLSAIWTPECANFVIAFRQFGPSSPTNRSSEEVSPSDWTPNYQIPARHSLASPLDLIDALIPIPKENDKTVRMKSPFSAEISSNSDYLERLLDDATITPLPVLIGVVDIMEAPREVLMVIPGMTASTADRVIAVRSKYPPESRPKSPAWLLTERIVNTQSLRPMLPWIAVRSDVYRTQSIGFRDPQSYVYRCTAILDARTLPASYHSLETWHTWDKGFDLESLQGDAKQ